MNMQYGLIHRLMLYDFKLGQKALETTKNICCAKDEGMIDLNIV